MIDSYGRTINYLRLSVTDRCNLRCSYCMPAEGMAKVDRTPILSYEDLEVVASAAVRLGIEKVRVTGGEPLIRAGILTFLRRLAVLPGVKELVLTTNGVLLPEMAADLRAAGVKRLNVSLDSLVPETFSRITRGGSLDRVLAGIAAAEGEGFPLKINMVVMGGVNDAEIVDFAALTLDRPLSVRFIEHMPTFGGERTGSVSGEAIRAALAKRFRLQDVQSPDVGAAARSFRIAGARGTIGLITPLSGHFCAGCNRIRVTSAGIARSCLFGRDSVNLRPFLKAGGEGVYRALQRVVSGKPERHRLQEEGHSPFFMAAIGG